MSATPQSRKGREAKLLRENLRTLTNGFRDWVEDALRPQGMTVPQIRLLYAVQQDPEASNAAIARQCQVTPQTLQSMMQRAVRERWLVRHPSPHNARVLVSALTSRGEAILLRALEAVEEFERQVWRGVSVTELQRMNALLSRACERMALAGDAPTVTLSSPKVPSHRAPGYRSRR